MAEELHVRTFDNGLVLLGDRMPHVVSTAMQIAIPAGARFDGDDLAGAATVASEWLFRGAGDRTGRQLRDALDALGCHYDNSVNSRSLHISAAQTHQNLDAVLAILAEAVRRPTLAQETFEPCRSLALQSLESLADEPSRRSRIRLRERFFPHPLGVSPAGTEPTLRALTPEAVRGQFRAGQTPAGAVVAVAGRFEWEPLCERVGQLFGDWTGPQRPDPPTRDPAGGVTHESAESAQMQITLAYPAAPLGDPHYYPGRVAEMILSGGMSGRLFTEVREKRGLVYSVGSRYHSLRGRAGVFTYAGTTPEKAQQTLEVTAGELKRLAEGVDEDELARAKTQLKAAMVMRGESTAARAGGLVSDWYLLDRLRTLEEIANAVDRVTAGHIVDCLTAWPAEGFTAYILGPKELDTACLE